MRLVEVAHFEPPDAVRRLEEWKEHHAAALAEVPDDEVEVHVGRAATGGTFTRVMVAADHCALFGR